MEVVHQSMPKETEVKTRALVHMEQLRLSVAYGAINLVEKQQATEFALGALLPVGGGGP
jgi:hypothetical protein